MKINVLRPIIILKTVEDQLLIGLETINDWYNYLKQEQWSSFISSTKC